MNSKSTRLFASGILVVAAVVLFVVLSGDDDKSGSSTDPSGTEAGTSAPAAKPVVIRYVGGEVGGGEQKLEFASGDRIRFNVALDDPSQVEEIHIHGYEIERPDPGALTRFDFPAKLEGQFEVELHLTDGEEAPLATIAVSPA